MKKEELEQALKEAKDLCYQRYSENQALKEEIKKLNQAEFDRIAFEKNNAVKTVAILEDICMALITHNDPRLERTKLSMENNKGIEEYCHRR